MKIILTILLVLIVSASFAQKKHIYYDTVKTITERVDYSPDTIPVYFKEIQFVNGTEPVTGMSNAEITSAHNFTVYENWHKGFVIWQTYKKATGITFSTRGEMWQNTEPSYYKDEYSPSPTMPGIFLYEDRKTIVKNKVILSIKR